MVFTKSLSNFPYGTKIDLDKIKSIDKKNFPINIIGIPNNLSTEYIKNESLKNISDSIANSKETEKNNEKTEPNHNKRNSKKNDNPYPFYGSSNDFISEAISCFRIIGDTLDLPIKTDNIRRSFVENIKEENSHVSLQLCAAISESLGLKTQLYEIPLGLINRLNFPALVQLKGKELAVLHAQKKDMYLLARPRYELKEYSLNDFTELLNNKETVPLLSLKTTDRTPKRKLSFKWFLPALKKNKKPLIEVLVASLFVQLFQLMNPLIIQQIIDKVIGQGGNSSLLPLVILLFSFSFFENILTTLRTNLFIDTTNRIDMSLGEQVIDHLLRLPLPYFDKRNVGELSSRVGELEQIRSFLTGTALTVVLDAVFQ